MTDKQLYQQCKKFGMAAIESRRKFTGLLPEVLKRDLHHKKGFSSIYEFAAKLAGLSRDQVDEVLRLEKRFQNKPILHKALIQGKVSVPKLVRVASIANHENQSDLLKKVQTLSKSAIDIFVKENRTDKPKTKQKSLYVQTLQLDEDVEKQLTELQQKGIDVNQLLRKFLEEREQKIERELQKISHEIQTEESEKAQIGYPITRHIPTKSLKIVTQKFGTKCAKPGCNKPAEQIHHVKPFAQHHSHDPQNLQPLCKGHHELTHNIQVIFQPLKE